MLDSVVDLSGDLSGLELLLDDESLRLYAGRGRGESSVGVSDSGSTRRFENAPLGISLGGSAGNDLSVIIGEASFSRAFVWAAALDFFRRRAIRDS